MHHPYNSEKIRSKDPSIKKFLIFSQKLKRLEACAYLA